MEIISSIPAPTPTPAPVHVPRISNLKPAVRDKNRVNVFIDEVFAFSLDLTQVVDFKLKIGLPVTPADRKKYEAASEFGKLYNSTLDYVLSRPHSEKEIRDHLLHKLHRRELENKKRELTREKIKSDPDFRAYAREKHLPSRSLPLFTEEDIENVISRLREKSYIDDRRFAQYYIENRNVKKGISRRQLSLELAQKGIDRTLVSELLVSSDRSETEEIKKIIQKKRHKKTSAQLLRYLVSKGFPYDLSKSLINDDVISEL